MVKVGSCLCCNPLVLGHSNFLYRWLVAVIVLKKQLRKIQKVCLSWFPLWWMNGAMVSNGHISIFFIWYDSFETLWDPATILRQQMLENLCLSMPQQNLPDAMQTIIIFLSTPYWPYSHQLSHAVKYDSLFPHISISCRWALVSQHNSHQCSCPRGKTRDERMVDDTSYYNCMAGGSLPV